MPLSSPLSKNTFLALLLSVLALFNTAEIHAAINFTSSGLQGESLNNPTSLQFGPDGRLYVSQQDGTIFAYTISRQASNNYVVTNVETILLVKSMLNHNDDGTLNASLGKRQVTGILLSGTAQQPILYVSSSDPRIGGPSGDQNLDTNSGVISRLIWNGNGWDKVDLVRGLPRSEENHAVNGMQLDETSNTLYLAVGGNTNAGSPSQNFASLTEYAYSCAILSIDLDAIDAMPTQTDFGGLAFYKYDLPTLDDPDRDNSSGNQDINDPWGGNDGLNQAKLVVDGPVQIYASGFRNAYDFLITRLPGKEGRMYTVDNGPNGGWGGHPDGEGPPNDGTSNATNQYLTGEPGSTGPGTGGDAKVNNKDNLHFVTEGFYGGHPSPIRANPTGAGLYTNDTNDASQGTWRTQASDLPVDWPPVPPSMVNPPEGDYLQPGVDDNALATFGSSTNGIAEYTASNFDGELQGDLILASFGGNLERIQLNATGDEAINVSTFASNFGSLPLDVVAQGDDGPFPGTIWAATYGSNNISIFEPSDYDGGNNFVCSGVYDPNIDEDGDGYSNAEEIDNGTSPCSASDVPADFDQDIVSNLYDLDDDNDGILDAQDAYPQDKHNGRSTSIPLDYPMLNGDPGIGFYGLGFTGLMSNGTDDYLALLRDELLIPGGTAGVLTIDGVTQTSAFEGQNNQENALQFGIDVNSTSGAFLIHVRMPGDVFGSIIPTDGRSAGAYIGTGDQDNYLMFAAVATSNGPELTLVHENNAVAETLTPSPNITGLTQLVNLNLFFLVNPGIGTVQPQYSIDDGPLTNLGAPIPLSGNLLSTLQGTDALAVGVIASATNDDGDFTAQWDFIDVTPVASDALGDWNDLAPAEPAPPSCKCHENAYVKAGNKYYLIGGRGDGRSVQIYDPALNTWSSGASLPIQMHHFQAVESDGLIYVVGAWTGGFPNEQNLDNIYIYNPASDSWHVGPAIPGDRNRGSTGAIAYKGKIYVVAGNDGGHNTGATLVSWFDEFDPATGTWTQLADAPRGRDHFQVAIVNDKMYVAGGRDSSSSDLFGSVIGEVDVYDFASNTWDTLPDDIPTKRAGAAAVTYNGEFIVMGGESAQAAAHNEVEALNPQTNTWRSLAPLNLGRHATQAIVDNGAIYIAAGSKTKGATEIDSTEAFFQEIYQVNGLLAPTENPLTPGVLTPVPSSLSFSTVQGLLPQAANIILSNTGGDQAIIVSSILKSGYAGIGLNINQAFPAIIPPNQTMIFEVTFDSNLIGEKTGDIYVQHEGANEDLIIPINGGSGDQPLVLYRINAGGTTLAGSRGLNWGADTKSQPSIFVNSAEANDLFTTTTPITLSTSVPSETPLALFQSERYDNSSAPEMQWNFPVSNGNYEVRLYFAENYSGAGSPGSRVFDVVIEDVLALDDYDVVADAGAMFVGVMQNFEVEVSDGLLTIDLLHVIQNPAIKGIEIIDLNDGTGGPVNNAPTIASINDQTNIIEDPVSLQVTASDSDGDTLSYSATGLPAGLSINTSSGLISGNIAFGTDTSSPYSVTVTVTDDGEPEESANTSFAWTVNSEGPSNNAPTLTPVDNQTNTVADTVSLQVLASDTDGDTLSYSATGLPAGLSINTSSGLISGNIAFGTDTSSPYSVTVTVTDDGEPEESANTSFAWTVNSEGPSNNAPTLTPVDNQTNTVADTVSLQVLASDTDGDTLSYSATGLPAGLSIDVSLGVISGTITTGAEVGSPYAVIVTITDDGEPNKSAQALFSWNVSAISQAEVLYRVNSGGSPLASIDSEPINWSGDTSSSPSSYVNSSQTNNTYTSGSSVTAGPSVPSEVPLALFQSERYDNSSAPEMQWNFPVSNGNYEVRLYFAENYSGAGSPGSRVFDVVIEDVLALDDYDVVADAGAMFVGVMQNFEVEVSDGLLTIDLLHVIQNPAIKGIEIIDLNDGTGGPVNNAPTIASINDQTNIIEDPVSLQVTASDSDGDTLSYSATGLPAGLSINTSSGLISGNIAFGSDTSSPYSVTVTVTDDGEPEESANTSFAWTVNSEGPSNNAPTLTPVDNQTNTVADTVSLQVLASDTDGDTLSYSATGLPAGLSIDVSLGVISGTITTGAEVGSPYAVIVTITDDGEPNKSAQALFSWNVSAISQAEVLYRVNSGGSPLASIDSEPINWSGDTSSSPSSYVNSSQTNNTYTSGSSVTAGPSVPSEVPLALFQSERYDNSSAPEMQWNFPVSNGNYEVRLYFAENYSGAGSPGSRVFDVVIEDVLALDDYDVVADAGAMFVGVMQNFEVEVSDGLLTIDLLHVIQNPAIKGIEIIDLNDGTGGPVNNAPTIASINDQTNIIEDPVSLQVTASDSDGDTLSYSATGLPAGLSINTSSGLISGNIAFGSDTSSPYSVTVTVTDDGEPEESANTSFAWTVNSEGPSNNAPTLTPVDNQTNTVADTVSLQVLASDTDGDTLSYSATGLPAGLSIDVSLGVISGTITTGAEVGSPYAVIVTITDDGEPNKSAQALFSWNVSAISQAEVLYRVNSGGSPLASIDSEPINWSGDTSSSPSSYVNSSQTNNTYTSGSSVTAGPSVPSEVPLALFQSERYDNSSAPEMQWNFPVSNGNYEVRLYFAENYSGAGSPGSRVFDVVIEDVLALDDYDVVADAGAMFVGVMQNFEVEVSDGLLTIDLLHVIQNPAIKGIEIIDLNDGTGGPVNNAPTIASINDQTNIIEDPVSLQVTASDSDGDTLSYSATGLPAGLSINTSSGLISGNIAFGTDTSSPYSVTVTVTDDGEPEESANTSFAWTVNSEGPSNNAPTLTPVDNQTNTVADTVSLQVLASDTDGDTLSYSATGLPAGLSINTSSGLISGNIAFGTDTSSPYSVTVTVTDDGEPEESANTSFAWTVNSEGPSNNAPTLTPVDNQTNTVADTVSLQVLASDTDGDTLSYSATGLPAGLSIDVSLGVISGTITTGAEVGSPYAVIVTITDDGEPNKSAQALFSWNVSAISQAEVLYRVNSGGSPLASIDSEPINWSGDTSSSPSSYVNSSQTNNTYTSGSSVTAGPSVPSEVPLALFQSERYDNSSAPEMQWNFPVSNGNYEVRLYFAENYSGAGSPGSRVFDVVIEDVLALDDYDVVADAGAMFVGVMQNFEVEVSDGLLTIDLLHVIQNPAIKGIEIIDITGSTENELRTSTSQIEFGGVTIDESSLQTFQLINNGGAGDPVITIDPSTATISGLNGDQFSVTFESSDLITLAPGNSTTVTVTFQPTTQAPYSAILNIPHSGNNTALAIALTGQGEAFVDFNWTVGTPSPIARVEAGGAVINDKIYVFGGFTNTSMDASLQSHVYDPSTNVWTRLADMPAKITHSICAVDGNIVWIVAGFDGNDPGVATNSVYKYNIVTDSWSQGPNLPEARGGGGTAIVGRELHFFGGYAADRNTNKADHWVLDLDNPTAWTTAANMPSPRGHLGVAVFSGKIYAVGGQFGHDGANTESDLMHVYDPATNTWAQAASLPFPRSHHEAGTIVHEDHIIVLGGQSAVSTNINDISAYDPATDTWKTLPTLPININGTIAAIINNQFYVTTGSINGGASPQTATYVAPWNSSALSSASSGSLSTTASSPQLVEQGLPDDSPYGTTQFSNYVMQIFATDSYDLEIQYNSSQAETVSWELLNTGETGFFVTTGSGASELQYIYDLTIPEGLQMLQLSYADGFSLEYIDALLSEPSFFSGYLSDTNAVTGNFQLLANVQELVSSGAKPEVGIIIEEPSSGASRFVQLGIQLDQNYYARASTDASGSVEELNTGVSGSFPNAWILLERTGDQVSVAVSSDNVSYQLLQVITLPSLSDTLDAGLYIDSGSENIDAKATLQNFEITPLP